MKLNSLFPKPFIWLVILLHGMHCSADSDTGNFPLCPTELDIPERPVVDVEIEPGDTYINAEYADLIEEGVSHLRGNVEITREQQQVRASEIYFDKPRNNANLVGDVNFWDESVYLHSDTADIEFENGTGVFSNADYRVIENRGRGHAEELFIDAGEITKGENMDFTTCDPETDGWDFTTNVWKISAREMVLNHETDRGTGKHVVVRIKDIPVFYTPYLTFPLSKMRKTGFLTPALGTSNNDGFEARTPFYWNIAPNMDATFTPRVVTDRGFMAMSEFRYVTESMSGQLSAEYLASDDAFNDRDRNLFEFEHTQQFLRNGRFYATFNRVSDPQYFEDFGSQISKTSQRYLPRRADISYSGRNWNLIARVQDYQTVDESIPVVSRPFKRLPQIRFTYTPLKGNRRINLSVNSEVAYFDRTDETGLVNDVAGFRTDLYPAVSYPIRSTAGFFIPKIGLRYTQYALDDNGPFKTSPSRILPMASADMGLFFERNNNLFGKSYLQTLEPRLFYLYIPDEEQDHLPVFDTALFTFSNQSLFRADRFSGPDRMGDANQVTAAITSRLLDAKTGRQGAFFRIAQIYYLSDQDVIRQSLNSSGQLIDVGVPNNELYSPLIGQFGVTFIDEWTFTGEFHWEPNDNITQKMAITAQYKPSADKVLNLAYRVRRAPSGVLRRNTTDIDQTDVSIRWPISRQWSAVGRWNHAVSENRTLDMFAGVEYDSCCFAVRAIARRFLTNLDRDYNNGFFLQFEMKGLAGLGQKTVDFLQQSIPGYRDGF